MCPRILFLLLHTYMHMYIYMYINTYIGWFVYCSSRKFNVSLLEWKEIPRNRTRHVTIILLAEIKVNLKYKDVNYKWLQLKWCVIFRFFNSQDTSRYHDIKTAHTCISCKYICVYTHNIYSSLLNNIVTSMSYYSIIYNPLIAVILQFLLLRLKDFFSVCNSLFRDEWIIKESYNL